MQSPAWTLKPINIRIANKFSGIFNAPINHPLPNTFQWNVKHFANRIIHWKISEISFVAGVRWVRLGAHVWRACVCVCVVICSANNQKLEFTFCELSAIRCFFFARDSNAFSESAAGDVLKMTSRRFDRRWHRARDGFRSEKFPWRFVLLFIFSLHHHKASNGDWMCLGSFEWSVVNLCRKMIPFGQASRYCRPTSVSIRGFDDFWRKENQIHFARKPKSIWSQRQFLTHHLHATACRLTWKRNNRSNERLFHSIRLGIDRACSFRSHSMCWTGRLNENLLFSTYYNNNRDRIWLDVQIGNPLPADELCRRYDRSA